MILAATKTNTAKTSTAKKSKSAKKTKTSTTEAQPRTTSSADRALVKRMARPQRHRLLQGYPMLPLMAKHSGARPVVQSARPLIIGVLPHPFCNPRVRGCGFCTFPHEPYARSAAEEVVEAVIAEITQLSRAHAQLSERAVHGVYFGGGTANLTPPKAFARLADALAGVFDLSSAEVTLEGVPKYFVTRDGAMLHRLMDIPARTRRISMGVQTFDRSWLARMGRQAFGDAADIEAIVHWCRQHGVKTSADLLFNLPGQSLDAMRADVQRAAALGLDQICLYNLVLYEGLGTEWSHDADLLKARHENERACAHWLALREQMHALGYEQTTLTNFERRDLPASARFRYERCSFNADAFDGLGLGPGGISVFSDAAFSKAIKTVNAGRASSYLMRIKHLGHATELSFDFGEDDLDLLFMTRGLSLMSLDRSRYRKRFGRDVMVKHLSVLRAAKRAGLLRSCAGSLDLTPKGMFYADALAGLLASKRVKALRPHAAGRRSVRHLDMLNDATHSPMG